jgi:hypothetical protein
VKASQLAAVPGALKNAERDELNQLRTEAKRLRMELDIF